jgi:hypothetical protein
MLRELPPPDQSLAIDAWAFLDIRHPMCAWNVYRGVLVSVLPELGFLSVWAASLLGHFMRGKQGPILRELALEAVRVQDFRSRVPRTRGFYCFQDLGSAERALGWGTHFRTDFLAELSLAKTKAAHERLDANWITYADKLADGSFVDHTWIPEYWQGKPMPGREPVWETLVEGRVVVLNTALRERAYRILRTKFPESMVALETGRLAAQVGSDMGQIQAFLHAVEGSDDVALDYFLDYQQVDFSRPENLEVAYKIRVLIDSGQVANRADILEQLRKGNFGKWPDLRLLGLRIPKTKLPKIGALVAPASRATKAAW